MLINELLDIYIRDYAPFAQIKKSTAIKNANCLKQIFGGDMSLSKLSFNRLNYWRQKEYVKAGLVAFKSPAKNYSLNSVFNQAKSVFSDKALAFYSKSGINIPSGVFDFKSASTLKPEKKPHFVAIKKDIDSAIQADCRKVLTGGKIDGLSDLSAVMILLARICGMTNSEIHHFNLSWILEDSDGIFIDICEREAEGGCEAFSTKRGKKNRQVPISREFLNALKSVLENRDFPYFGRYELHTYMDSEYRRCCKYLGKTLKSAKKLHELRKMACSDVLSREKNIYAAANFIGDSVETTAKFYAAQLKRIAPLNF